MPIFFTLRLYWLVSSSFSATSAVLVKWWKARGSTAAICVTPFSRISCTRPCGSGKMQLGVSAVKRDIDTCMHLY
ncbi:hypothetical protein D3C76_1350850 [compost metagenome]